MGIVIQGLSSKCQALLGLVPNTERAVEGDAGVGGEAAVNAMANSFLPSVAGKDSGDCAWL